MEIIVKPIVLSDCNAAINLKRIDLNESNNLLNAKDMTIGFTTTSCPSGYQPHSKAPPRLSCQAPPPPSPLSPPLNLQTVQVPLFRQSHLYISFFCELPRFFVNNDVKKKLV